MRDAVQIFLLRFALSGLPVSLVVLAALWLWRIAAAEVRRRGIAKTLLFVAPSAPVAFWAGGKGGRENVKSKDVDSSNQTIQTIKQSTLLASPLLRADELRRWRGRLHASDECRHAVHVDSSQRLGRLSGRRAWMGRRYLRRRHDAAVGNRFARDDRGRTHDARAALRHEFVPAGYERLLGRHERKLEDVRVEGYRLQPRSVQPRLVRGDDIRVGRRIVPDKPVHNQCTDVQALRQRRCRGLEVRMDGASRDKWRPDRGEGGPAMRSLLTAVFTPICAWAGVTAVMEPSVPEFAHFQTNP